MDSIMQVLKKVKDRVYGTEHTVTVEYHQSCREDWYSGVCSCGNWHRLGTSQQSVYGQWRDHLRTESTRQDYYEEEEN